MSQSSDFSIQEEPNIIDDHLLDIIGNEFKFSHEKGLSEWLKNASDAYSRVDVPQDDQYVIFRFTDGMQKQHGVFECIDFVGMTENDIDKAFKRWGDPEAAARGQRRKMYGGHGNGGKFYMRQMFVNALFITYRDESLNVFGFNENRKYGYAKGYKARKFSPNDAMIFAGLAEMELPTRMRERILAGETGFTIVRGVGPDKMKKKVRIKQLIRKLKHHPQARQVLKRMNVSCVHNDKVVASRLEPDEIPPMKDFEEPFFMEIPQTVTIKEDGEEIEVELSNKKFALGHIVLRTSAESFGAGSMSDLNRIEVLGEYMVIASYHMKELPYLKHPELADFIYGECTCPILEDPEDDCVKNDRSRLQEDNVKTKALLQWICQQVDALAELIHEEKAKYRKREGDKLSSQYNKILNDWKNKMMPKFMQDWQGGKGKGMGIGIGEEGQLGTGTLGDVRRGGGEEGGAAGTETEGDGGEGGVGGGFGGGEGGTGEKGEDEGAKGGTKGSDKPVEGQGGGDEKIKSRRFRQVLLSSIDSDPLNTAGNSLDLPPAQLAVYQRLQDIDHGIYWINTSRPLAEAIMSKHGRDSVQWRNYLFQRYVDIFVKEALLALESQEVELNMARIDYEIARTIQRSHDAAAEDLQSFLFDEKYVTSDVTE